MTKDALHEAADPNNVRVWAGEIICFVPELARLLNSVLGLSL
jgi:hypothetical protein